MKKILLATFSLAVLFIMPVVVDAAPKCDSNRAPNLQMDDPACYTSRTTSSSTTTREVVGRTFHSSCSWRVDCRNCSYPCNNSRGGACRATFYTSSGSCGGHSRWCSNMGSPPKYGYYTNDYGWVTRTTTSTAYTCYYQTVETWGTCDVNTGMQSATAVTQHSRSGTNCQNYNEATTQTCAACGIASVTPTGEIPLKDDRCIPLNEDSTPVLNTVTNMWEWTCKADSGTVPCEVQNEEDGKCASSYSGKPQDWAVGATPPSDLCDGGTMVDFVDHGDAGWTWMCARIGENPDHSDKECAAPCFDYRVSTDNPNFYWTESDEFEVTVNLEKMGRCADAYSCTITGGTKDVPTHTYTIEAGQPSYDIGAICNYEGDEDPDCTNPPCPPSTVDNGGGTISGNCITKSCTAQGTCQSVPRSALNHETCKSTCSSNADCSKGRMIETRP